MTTCNTLTKSWVYDDTYIASSGKTFVQSLFAEAGIILLVAGVLGSLICGAVATAGY